MFDDEYLLRLQFDVLTYIAVTNFTDHEEEFFRRVSHIEPGGQPELDGSEIPGYRYTFLEAEDGESEFFSPYGFDILWWVLQGRKKTTYVLSREDEQQYPELFAAVEGLQELRVYRDNCMEISYIQGTVVHDGEEHVQMVYDSLDGQLPEVFAKAIDRAEDEWQHKRAELERQFLNQDPFEAELTGRDLFNALVFLDQGLDNSIGDDLLSNALKVRRGRDEYSDPGLWVTETIVKESGPWSRREDFYDTDYAEVEDWVAKGRPLFSCTVLREDHPELFDTDEFSLTDAESVILRGANAPWGESFHVHSPEGYLLEYYPSKEDTQRLRELLAPALENEERKWQLQLQYAEEQWMTNRRVQH